MTTRIYPAAIMAREIARLSPPQQREFLRIDGVDTTSAPRPTLGRSMFAAILDDANFCRVTPQVVTDRWYFESGDVVCHRETGHLSEVVCRKSEWDAHRYEVTYRLRWLTVDWRDAHWVGAAFSAAAPLEMLAAQGL